MDALTVTGPGGGAGSGTGGSGTGGGAAGARAPGGEPLGSARDEAARLVEALSAWASGALGPPGSAFTAAREHLGAESIATGAPECRLCPVCQLIGAVRGVRPEVLEHLLDAAGSLLAAVKTGLETPPPPSRGGRVEHIDIG